MASCIAILTRRRVGIPSLYRGPRARFPAAAQAEAGEDPPLVAGSVCGALWILLVDTAANTAIPDAMNEPAVLAVGVVTALGAASLLSLPNRLSEMVGLSAMAIGFHSLALPIAALISLLLGAAQAGDLRTVALSVGGLLLGLFLVFIGDRVLRGRRMRSSRPRFDLSGPPA